MNKELKIKRMLHFKALTSKNEKIQLKGFDYLVGQFYPPETLNLDEFDFLDYYHATLAMMYQLIGELVEDGEDYETVVVLRSFLKLIKQEMLEEIETSDEFEEFKLSNSFFEENITKMLKTIIK